MKFKFDPDDFLGIVFLSNIPRIGQNNSEITEEAAHIANTKLEEWLKDAPIVYAHRIYSSDPISKLIWYPKEHCSTDKAKLVCIEEIK